MIPTIAFFRPPARPSLSPAPCRRGNKRANPILARRAAMIPPRRTAAIIRAPLFGEGVEVVCLELLRRLDVDPALVFGHQLLPPGAAGVGRAGLVVRIEIGLGLPQLFIDQEIRPDEVAVLRAAQAVLFQSQFKERDLAGLIVADQPVVGVTAVVAFEHDARVIVNRVAVLHRLAGALEFGLPFGSNPVKPVIVVSVIMIPLSLTPKSSMLEMTPGNPSINILWPFSGLMSKTMFQREPMT